METALQKLSVVARQAGISSRHALKSFHFYQAVTEVLASSGRSYDRVANFFCGNGLASWYWLTQTEGTEMISADLNLTNKYLRVEQQVLAANPELRKKNTFFQSDLTAAQFYARLELDRLVIAIHACNSLTDALIQHCTDRGLDFAVATCCHTKNSLVLEPRHYPDGSQYQEHQFDQYQDQVRAQFARERGYVVNLIYFARTATPMNRVIVGLRS